jgi:hypothetical protein
MNSNQYFSYTVPKLSVKTIVLDTPEGCLSANTIRKKLIQEGHQLLPESMHPNMVKISYLENSENSENDQKNMIFAESGSYGILFLN